MSQPEYWRQSGDLKTREQVREWVTECWKEAQEEGCTFPRISWEQCADGWVHLFEAWKERPEDQGPPRFALTYADTPPL